MAVKKKATKKVAKKATKKVAKKATKKAAPKKATKKAAPKKATKKAAKKPAKKRKPNAAFMRPLSPSPILANVIGSASLPRTEAVKKIWVYIKKNGLQDRRNINADDKLKPLFNGKKVITMFELAGFLSKHLK